MHVYHRDLYALTHSFPTRRSADLGFHRHLAVVADGRALEQRVALAPSCQSRHQPASHGGLLDFAAPVRAVADRCVDRSEEHTSELQSLMRISYAVFWLKKKTSSHVTSGILRDDIIIQLQGT